MATIETPRLQRAFAYALAEARAVDPKMCEPLANDYHQMLRQDLSEINILKVLLTIPVILAAAELAKVEVTKLFTSFR